MFFFIIDHFPKLSVTVFEELNIPGMSVIYLHECLDLIKQDTSQ